MRACLLLLLLLLAGCAPSISGPVPLRLAGRELVQADSMERVFALHFRDPRGGRVDAYLREPAPERLAGVPLPGIVLVAGRETGRRAASVIPGPLEGVVLAVEYPADIPEELEAGDLLERLPEIRRSALRMPGILRGAARFLAIHPRVDSTRLALVGVSFGVPFAAPAGKDPVFRGVALHHGGAGLARLFRANLPVRSRFLRGVAARFAAWYFRPLEPARHVDEISPRPLLLVNGLHDTLVPRESALLLAEKARPPVRHLWLPHDHLMPGDTAVMRELADSTLRHFDFLQVDAGRETPAPGTAGAYEVELLGTWPRLANHAEVMRFVPGTCRGEAVRVRLDLPVTWRPERPRREPEGAGPPAERQDRFEGVGFGTPREGPCAEPRP